MILLLALAAAIFAEGMEKVDFNRLPSSAPSLRSRAVGFLIATMGACLLQVYTITAFDVSQMQVLCLSALLGAVIVRIAVSDARLCFVPDGLCVSGFSILALWRWSVHYGEMPDLGTAAVVAAVGILIFLLALALFIIFDFYLFPPVDTLILILFWALPVSDLGVYIGASLMAALLILRRLRPSLGLIFMSPEKIEGMRVNGASVFGDDEVTASDPSRYFPLGPMAILSMTGMMIITILLTI